LIELVAKAKVNSFLFFSLPWLNDLNALSKHNSRDAALLSSHANFDYRSNSQPKALKLL
jgi:hypothetical protein